MDTVNTQDGYEFKKSAFIHINTTIYNVLDVYLITVFYSMNAQISEY